MRRTNGIKLGGAPQDSPLGANAIARHNICHSNTRIGFNVNGGKNVLIEFNTAYANGAFGYELMKDTVLASNLSLGNLQDAERRSRADDKLGHVGWSKSESQSNNSWQMDGALEVLSVDPTSNDFLKFASGRKFKGIGAYATHGQDDAKE